MTSRDFCYWLQGFFELHPTDEVRALNETQVALLRGHLALVFKHEIDPSAGPPPHQAALNEIHKGSKPKPNFGGGHGPGGFVYRC